MIASNVTSALSLGTCFKVKGFEFPGDVYQSLYRAFFCWRTKCHLMT